LVACWKAISLRQIIRSAEAIRKADPNYQPAID